MDQQPENKFLHYRYADDRGNIHARGGLTFAYRTTDTGEVVFANAKCHLNDNFSKITARNKAGGRLQSPKFAKTFKGNEQDFLVALEQDIENYNTYAYAAHPGLTLVRKYSGKRKLAAPLTGEDNLAFGS